MKKTLIFCMAFIIFYGQNLVNYLAFADPSENVSIVAEDGVYSAYLSDQTVSEAQLTMMSNFTTAEVAPIKIKPSVKAEMQQGDYGDQGPFKTYYAPGDQLILWASWPPINKWGVPWVGKQCNVKLKLTDEKKKKVTFEKTHKRTLSLDDTNWIGLGYSFVIPSSTKNKTSFTLRVEIGVSGTTTVSGDNKLYVTTVPIDDLPLPWTYPYMASQNSWLWKTDTLGTCKPEIDTMGKLGCATTCKAFLFNYYVPNTTAQYFH